MPKQSENRLKGDSSEGGVEAVDRAMQILSAFTPREGALGLHELSIRTGFYKSTLLRLLKSLEKARMIQRRPDKMFVLGPEVMRLSAVFQHNYSLADNIRPLLKHIIEVTGESASFFVRQGDQRMCLLRENPPRSIRHHSIEGDVMPLSMGSSGRVLTDFRDIRADDLAVRLLRALPYVAYGEFDPEIAGISAPVFAKDNSLAGALSLSGPLHRFTPHAVAEYKGLVLASAWKISEILGANIRGLVAARVAAGPARKRSSSR